MSDTIDPHLRDLLRKIIRRSGQKVSSSAIIRDFQRDQISAAALRQFAEIIRHDSLAISLYEDDVDTNATTLRQYPPIKWLHRFLKAYTIKLTLMKEIHNAAKKSQQSLASNDSPATRETRTSMESQAARDSQAARGSQVSTDSLHSNKSHQQSQYDPKTVTQISDFLRKVKAEHDEHQQQTLRPDQQNLTDFPINIDRPHNLWYFNGKTPDRVPYTPKAPNCAALPVPRQEQLIIDDLLYCFIGSTGDYITPRREAIDDDGFAPITFTISDQIDISLRNIVSECLPMASHYSIVQKFTQWSTNLPNQILHALSEVLQDILKDYRASICQLELQKADGSISMNLHKLVYLIRPNMQILQQLTEVLTKIAASDLSGGSILTLLYDEITLQTGDPKVQRMLINVTERTAQPYIEMLELWLLKGVICDGFEQFFVIDHGFTLDAQRELHPFEEFDTAQYWESRYTVHPERIPRFLESDAGIILRTGKYLNVIRQCGKRIDGSGMIDKKLEFSATTMVHSAFIKQAYHSASKTLLDLLVNENNLMAHISSVKRYFLLQQGDLITQFMDASEEELSKHVDKVTPVRLDNLLQLIVRMSSAKHDPCLEYLHCGLFTVDLVKQMTRIHVTGNYEFDNYGNSETHEIDGPEDTANLNLSGLECFAFKYNVHWPVSIVLNQRALLQYQMLFRLLFYCKHVDRQLCKVWIDNNEIGKSKPKLEKDQWRTVFALRQRMLNAIQHLEYYMMIEVIEPNWHIFTEKMKTVQNVDDVIMIHQDFLHICLQNCMLHYPDLLRALMNIGGVCLRFCKLARSETGKNSAFVAWKINIETIGKEFNDLLVDFIKALSEQSSDNTPSAKFINLVCRLNFNSFYN